MQISNIDERHLASLLNLNEESVALLSPLDPSTLWRMIKHASLGKVVTIDHQVAGFLLAFSAKADYQSVNYQWFNARYENFLYIDRIVIDKAFRGRGIAATMYEFVLNYAYSEAKTSLVAEIDMKPPNVASLNLHKRFGFVEVEQFVHHPNKIVSMQRCKLSQ